jgi:hypothetical protein
MMNKSICEGIPIATTQGASTHQGIRAGSSTPGPSTMNFNFAECLILARIKVKAIHRRDNEMQREFADFKGRKREFFPFSIKSFLRQCSRARSMEDFCLAHKARLRLPVEETH